MLVNQLRKACQDAMTAGNKAVVVVRTDGRLLLCGNRGPRGELLCVTDGQSVVRYKAHSVLSFLDREERKAAAIKAAGNEVLG